MPYSDPAKAKERRRRYRELHPERHQQQQRQWKDKYRATANALHRKRRATVEGKRKDKDYRLKAQYGITHEQYDAMLQAQHGVCAICLTPESRAIRGVVTPLIVDHNHQTGAVRALLCHRCNASIGFLDESADRMRALAAYIDRHEQRRSEDGSL